MVARIRAACACELPLRSLFEAPTIAALAERIDRRPAGAAEQERMPAEIRRLSDHEVEQLLRAERAAGTGGAD